MGMSGSTEVQIASRRFRYTSYSGLFRRASMYSNTCTGGRRVTSSVTVCRWKRSEEVEEDALGGLGAVSLRSRESRTCLSS